MAQHFKHVCRKHEVVVAQCRCPGSKWVKYVACPGAHCPGNKTNGEKK